MSENCRNHNGCHDCQNCPNHQSRENNEPKFWKAFAISVFIGFVEIAGGILSGGLAIYSDAVHIMSDAIGNIVAIIAERFGKKEKFSKKKCENWGAIINGHILLFSAMWICIESLNRFYEEISPINLEYMLAAAVVGLVGSIFAHNILGHSHGNSNHLAMKVHYFQDILISAVVIVSVVVIYFTGWKGFDPLVSLFLGGYFIYQSVNLIKKSAETILKIQQNEIKTLDP